MVLALVATERLGALGCGAIRGHFGAIRLLLSLRLLLHMLPFVFTKFCLGRLSFGSLVRSNTQISKTFSTTRIATESRTWLIFVESIRLFTVIGDLLMKTIGLVSTIPITASCWSWQRQFLVITFLCCFSCSLFTTMIAFVVATFA